MLSIHLGRYKPEQKYTPIWMPEKHSSVVAIGVWIDSSALWSVQKTMQTSIVDKPVIEEIDFSFTSPDYTEVYFGNMNTIVSWIEKILMLVAQWEKR